MQINCFPTPNFQIIFSYSADLKVILLEAVTFSKVPLEPQKASSFFSLSRTAAFSLTNL